MKKSLLLLAMCLMSVFISNAETYYFIKSGTELTSNTSVTMVYTSGSKCYCLSKKASEISAKLNSDLFYWDNFLSEKLDKTKDPYVYDASMSTSKYEVYRSTWRGESQPTYEYGPYGTMMIADAWAPGPRIGDYYRGISSDGNSMVSWKQRKNSDEVLNKIYYERVDESILNQDPHDFLR